MGIFEKAGREVDENVDDARRTGRRVLRHARSAGIDASAEVRALIDQLDDSLRNGNDTDVEVLRKRLQEQISQARSILDDAGNTVRARLEYAVSATEDRIHQRPWETVAAVAGVAFLLGVIAAR
jgi:ElaB/YqjD/DUF883 family membrane-anchored ribosome-binding protein